MNEYALNLDHWFLTEQALLEQVLSAGGTVYVHDGCVGFALPLYSFDESVCVTTAGQAAAIWLSLSDKAECCQVVPLHTDHYCPRYFMLPGTKAAIAAADGLCLLVPNVWTVLKLRALGIANVLCWLPQEKSIPHDLVNALEWLEVQTVLYCYRSDTEDRQVAVQLFNRLASSSIDCLLFRISDSVSQMLSDPLFSIVHLL